MIPIPLKDEPNNFHNLVRVPGTAFLLENPIPTENLWQKAAHWRKILPTMRTLYDELCSYCSTWIPHSTGCHSVDHFIPKSQNPEIAYEWDNLRYVSSRFNSRKSIRRICDPIGMNANTFVIDFSTFFICPNTAILDEDGLSLAEDTIEVLNLNGDDELVFERFTYYKEYLNGDISYDYLLRRAPFIAYELDRQNLRGD